MSIFLEEVEITDNNDKKATAQAKGSPTAMGTQNKSVTLVKVIQTIATPLRTLNSVLVS